MQKDLAHTPELFCVTVDGMENNECQGMVRFADGTEARFVSLLELLHLIQDKLEKPVPHGNGGEQNEKEISCVCLLKDPTLLRGLQNERMPNTVRRLLPSRPSENAGNTFLCSRIFSVLQCPHAYAP